MSKRRMVGWQPLAVENTEAPAAPAALTLDEPQLIEPTPATEQPTVAAAEAAPASATLAAPAVAQGGPIQDPNVPRRRMAGWQPLAVTHDNPVVAPAILAAAAAPAPVIEDLPRRRMDGWTPLQFGHPDSVAPVVEAAPASAPVAAPAAPRRRMGAHAAAPAATEAAESASAASARRMGSPVAAEQTEHPAAPPEVKMPAAAPMAAQSLTAESSKKQEKPAEKKELSKTAKVLISLGVVAIVAAGLVLLAQWLRTLGPVADFIATYDGTPTHPDSVEAGIPGWVGWQHFFNFFIMAMVIRSGWLIRQQERPEAYWTPNDGGFFSPNKKNSPQKVSIQQWIHQSFNVLWVVNGLLFYIMVFATGHWMRIVPTNWDIFPNIVSAGVQYMSLDWPEEQSWIYYNALQIMTYFITVFIAAPIAVLTGLRLSTWWPQKAERINKVFTLPVARKIHFITMVYFILFIIVHLFLVFTTGVLNNLNIMFTARESDDWIGIGVFALSVAFTVGVAWLIKPIFISPIAEKSGTVSTR